MARSDDELEEQLNKIDPDKAAGGGSQWPGMSYEQGVDATLRWALEYTDDEPMSDD